MRPAAATPLVLFAALLTSLGGCGAKSASTPVACLGGAGAYARALREAPAKVKLSGQTPISECLVRNQQTGELATIGTSMVVIATRLNTEARADPGGTDNVALGYLVGAAQHGAEDTGGIHTELIRRLTVASRYSPHGRPLPAPFLRAYRRGYIAGHTQG